MSGRKAEVIDRRKLHEAMLDVIAKGLHYFEKGDSLDWGSVTTAEVVRAFSGGRKRYHMDAIYRAKVNTLVAHLDMAIDLATEARKSVKGKP